MFWCKKKSIIGSYGNPTGLKTKICNKCYEEKNISEFYKHCRRKDGLNTICKKCTDKTSKKYRKSHLKQIKISSKKYRTNHPDRIKETRTNWKKANKEKHRLSIRKALTKIRSTSQGRLNHRIQNQLRKALKQNKAGRQWENILGYTVNDLKKHLEKLFKDGMNWAEFLRGNIHIDHKIPINVFNFAKSEDIDFKKCWALSNLQPMWAKDNREKSDKLDKPFQPSFNF